MTLFLRLMRQAQRFKKQRGRLLETSMRRILIHNILAALEHLLEQIHEITLLIRSILDLQPLNLMQQLMTMQQPQKLQHEHLQQSMSLQIH